MCLRQSKHGCYPKPNPRAATLQIMDGGPHVPWTKNGNGLWSSHHYMWDSKDNRYTIWLFNIAMENNPFIDDFPCEKGLMAILLSGHIVLFFYFCGPIPYSSWFYISGLREDLRLKPQFFLHMTH